MWWITLFIFYPDNRLSPPAGKGQGHISILCLTLLPFMISPLWVDDEENPGNTAVSDIMQPVVGLDFDGTYCPTQLKHIDQWITS